MNNRESNKFNKKIKMISYPNINQGNSVIKQIKNKFNLRKLNNLP